MRTLPVFLLLCACGEVTEAPEGVAPIIVEMGVISLDTAEVPHVAGGCLPGETPARSAADDGWECAAIGEVDLSSYDGDAAITGDLAVGGSLSVGGDLSVAGALRVDGRLVGACPPEMATVGDTCVDRYEASIWDGPACDGTGGPTSDFTGFPGTGNWTVPKYACSLPGVAPVDVFTWFQAQQACTLVGKRLCSNAEWQAAAAGTPAAGCNDDPAGAKEPTGARPACVSNYGVFDLGGNVAEWVDVWAPGGLSWMLSDAGAATPWVTAFYGGGPDDGTFHINGRAFGTNPPDGTGFVDGLPSAWSRGGSHAQGTAAGIYNVDAAGSPGGFTGFRCCRDL